MSLLGYNSANYCFVNSTLSIGNQIPRGLTATLPETDTLAKLTDPTVRVRGRKACEISIVVCHIYRTI
jgi:hypothetical protein